jgi:hypothetical protein
MLLCAVWYTFTDVSDVLAATIIRLLALKMEAASISEAPVSLSRKKDATFQKTANFILAVVRTRNLTTRCSWLRFRAVFYNLCAATRLQLRSEFL